jgi:hypothetical protein
MTTELTLPDEFLQQHQDSIDSEQTIDTLALVMEYVKTHYADRGDLINTTIDLMEKYYPLALEDLGGWWTPEFIEPLEPEQESAHRTEASQ